MKDAEEMVKGWLQELSLVPERYTKKEMRNGLMTPDFKVIKEQQLQFFCEVKAVLDKGKGNSENDTTPNQLTDDIHDSFKKFSTVGWADSRKPNNLLGKLINYAISKSQT